MIDDRVIGVAYFHRRTIKPAGISDEVSAGGSSLRPTAGFTDRKYPRADPHVNENDVPKVVNADEATAAKFNLFA
jgi:hypothetical protein